MIALQMTLKKKWFDMIASGEKKEEYREIKDYWVTRLSATPVSHFHEFCPDVDFRPYKAIIFKNGYAKDAPALTVECEGIEVGKAKPEWSDNWQGDVFIIKLGKIISNTVKP